MKAALVTLSGADHPELGVVVDARLGDRAAVALSRGRFPKPYRHVDPNEDAVLAAGGPGGWLLAAVDGHLGFDAAGAALGAVADRAPTLVRRGCATPPDVGLEATCRAARDAVNTALRGAFPPRVDSRAALTLTLVRGGRMWVASFGDTVCLRVRGGRTKVIRRHGWPFLGPDVDIPPIVQARVRPSDGIVVASDGLTTYLGRHWAARTASVLASASDPVTAVRGLVELAMDGGAGDHIAVGVLL